jgi:hypothetical protein
MPTTTVLPRSEDEVLVDPAEEGRETLPAFLAGDIVNFAGRNDWYGRLSRWIMRTRGESPTYSVHTAQFLDADQYLEFDITVKIKPTGEILRKHQAHDMWERRGFEVWRCRGLTDAQRQAVTQQALKYLGAKFGFGKVSTHTLDGLLSKLVGREVYFFRRLNHDQRYPICSWITAFSYDRALHYQFGVPPECADPDAIDDWVRTHAEEWECVFRLAAYA